MERVGNWRGVRNLINNLGNDLEDSRLLALKRWGLEGEKIVTKHISSQDLNWAQLKARTITEKIKKGYSENILVRSSQYFQSITSWVYTGAALIGVKKIKKNKEGKEIANIAKTLEYGSESRNIPARPLWRPSMKELYKEIFTNVNLNPLHIFKSKL